MQNFVVGLRHLKFLWLTLGAFVIIGCQPQQAPSPLDAVTVHLKWVHQAQFSGFYVAQEEGYYAEENIDVPFVEGVPGIDIVSRVHNREVDFGVAAPEQILLNHSQRQPAFAASLPLIHTEEDQIGWMRPEIWTDMHDLLLNQGFLSGPLDVEATYTLQFLNAVYGDIP